MLLRQVGRGCHGHAISEDQRGVIDVRSLRLVVVGTLASNPYAGMAWMHMQITAGLRRLGHDVHYFEMTSAWPYDPLRLKKVADSDYAVPFLARLAEGFGLGHRWAYRRSYADGEWFGLDRPQLTYGRLAIIHCDDQPAVEVLEIVAPE